MEEAADAEGLVEVAAAGAAGGTRLDKRDGSFLVREPSWASAVERDLRGIASIVDVLFDGCSVEE